MSEELKTSEELAAEAETSAAETPEITETAAPEEPAETMADYAEELEASFKQIHEGDILTGTVIGVSESEITLDLKYYTEGIIRLEDFTSDPGFNLKEDVHIGDEISATVIRRDDGEGHILLSSKEANDILAWDKFKKYMEEGTNLTVKVGGIVKSGVVAYLDGIRGFIPASRLSLNYVEEDALNDWLGKELEVRVINADTENKRLVLSAREILREKADEERKAKVSNVQVGLVTEGTVETIKPYGAFINLGNGLSGLLHVSQICEKRIKTPAAVLSEGDTVKVKITAIKDGKLSLKKKSKKRLSNFRRQKPLPQVLAPCSKTLSFDVTMKRCIRIVPYFVLQQFRHVLVHSNKKQVCSRPVFVIFTHFSQSVHILFIHHCYYVNSSRAKAFDTLYTKQ